MRLDQGREPKFAGVSGCVSSVAWSKQGQEISWSEGERVTPFWQIVFWLSTIRKVRSSCKSYLWLLHVISSPSVRGGWVNLIGNQITVGMACEGRLVFVGSLWLQSVFRYCYFCPCSFFVQQLRNRGRLSSHLYCYLHLIFLVLLSV